MQVSPEIVHFECQALGTRKEKRGSKTKRKQPSCCQDHNEVVRAHADCSANTGPSCQPLESGEEQVVVRVEKKRRRKKLADDAGNDVLVPSQPSCCQGHTEVVRAHADCSANTGPSCQPIESGEEQVVVRVKKKRRRKKLADDAGIDVLVPSTQQRTTFQTLCEDVMVEILLFLRPRTIFRACLTCKAVASAAQLAGLWRRLYLKHSSCASTHKLCRMAMPCPVWRTLYKSMFLTHVNEKRAKKRKRNRTASDATKNPQWSCPQEGCSASLENQSLLHQHLRKHFKKSFSSIRHYCPHLLCSRSFPEARGAAVHSTQSCPFRPELRGGPWTCGTCDALFVYYEAYRAHLGENIRCPSPNSGDGSQSSIADPCLALPPPPVLATGRKKKRKDANSLSSHLPLSLCSGSGSIADALRRGGGREAGEEEGAEAAGEGERAAAVASARSEVVEVVTREAGALLASRGVEVDEGGNRRYHGVSLHNGRWRAEVQVRGFRVHLGKFADPRWAAIAYDAALLLLASHMQRRPGAKGAKKLNFKEVALTPSILSAVEQLVASHLASNPRARPATTASKRGRGTQTAVQRR